MNTIKSRRILAVIFDYVFYAIMNYIILLLLKGLGILTTDYIGMDYEQFKIEYLMEYIFSMLFIIMYFVVMPLRQNGQTWGKKIMKITVVREDGEKLRFKQLLFRNVFFSIQLLGIVSFLISPDYLFLSKTSNDLYGLILNGDIAMDSITILFLFLQFAILAAVFISFFPSGGYKGLNDFRDKTRVELVNH